MTFPSRGRKKRQSYLAIKHIIWDAHYYQNTTWVKTTVDLTDDGCNQRRPRLLVLHNTVKQLRASALCSISSVSTDFSVLSAAVSSAHRTAHGP